MMKKYLAHSVELSQNAEMQDDCFVLEYYVTESPCQFEEAADRCIYGLEVVKRHGNTVENSSVQDYSLYKDQAVVLAQKLCSNRVTPVGLLDVVSDLIGV